MLEYSHTVDLFIFTGEIKFTDIKFGRKLFEREILAEVIVDISVYSS